MTRIADIGRRDIITVSADTLIEKAVRLMLDHGLRGLPVVDAGDRLIGVLTEDDLLVRHSPRRSPRWWQGVLGEADQLARRYQKAVGMTVGEVMTQPAISIDPDAAPEAAAALMHAHGLGMLPVVIGDRVVDVVTLGDVLRDLARAAVAASDTVPDAALVEEMRRRMKREPWVSPRGVYPEAHEGVLTLHGLIESRAERSALVTMARAIPGCRGVEERLVVRREVASTLAV